MRTNAIVRVVVSASLLTAFGCGNGAKGTVKDYLAQKDCADRAKFILNPEANKALMLDYYKAHNVSMCVTEHQGVDDSQCGEVQTGGYCFATAKGLNHRYALKRTAEGFKVDFRGTYGYGPETLRQFKAQITAGVAPKSATVRVLAKIDSGRSGDSSLPIDIKDESSSPTEYASASVDRKTPAASELTKLLLDGKEHRVMLVLGRDGDGLAVIRLVQDGWNQRDDELK